MHTSRFVKEVGKRGGMGEGPPPHRPSPERACTKRRAGPFGPGCRRACRGDSETRLVTRTVAAEPLRACPCSDSHICARLICAHCEQCSAGPASCRRVATDAPLRGRTSCAAAGLRSALGGPLWITAESGQRVHGEEIFYVSAAAQPRSGRFQRPFSLHYDGD
jgi:hypothetical protein